MNKKFKILFLEDNKDDAELNSIELKNAGFRFISKRVETRDKFIQELAEFDPDIILADYSMPSFNGMEALRIVQERNLNVPFIFVTGSLGEELAVETMKSGATDYVLKQNLKRLGPSVSRVLNEIEETEKRKTAEAALQESEEKYRRLFNTMTDAFVAVDMKGKIIEYNNIYRDMLGYSDNEIRSLSYDNITPEKWHSFEAKIVEEQILKNGSSDVYEKEYRRKDGLVFPVELRTSLMRDDEGNPAGMWAIVRDITERKKSEEDLRISESFLNNIINLSPIPMWISDEKGILARINKSCCEMLKISPADVIGKYNLLEDNIVKEQGFMPLVQRVFDRGDLVSFELEYDTSALNQLSLENKAQVILETTIFPIKDPSGKVTSAVIQHVDITKRMLAEIALRESERFAKNTVNALDINMAILDKDGIIVSVNNAWRSFNKENNGDHARSNEGVNYLEICDKAEGKSTEGAAEVAAGIRAIIAGLTDNYKLEYPCNSPDTQRWFSLGVNRFHGEGPVRIVVSHTNITDRKIAEDELKKYHEHLEELVKERTSQLARSRNMLRTLIDTLPDEIYAKDSESRFIMANFRVLNTFGLTRFDDILGKSDFNLLPREEAMKEYAKEHSIVQRDGQMINYEECIVDTSGKKRWLAVTKVPMQDKEGNITGLVGINRDITYFKETEEILKKAKEAAEAANIAKSSFLSNMSHEIRTPLNAILGFSELMQYDDDVKEKHLEWLKTINRSGEYLLALINDILEVARIEAGRITYNQSNFDLHALLHDIQAMFKIKADGKNLTLLFEYSNELPKYVITDESKLRQIIINLVGNAVKFTKTGGIVFRTRTKAEKDKIRLTIEVEDTGAGIAQKDINKLFQKFGQTEAGIKEGGTGLGLVISQQYAKIMNGDITVKSEVDKGTCFTLTIDIENGEELVKEGNQKGRAIRLKPGQKLYRILVADDHANNRELLKIMLTTAGFKVEEAKNGDETIEKFKTWSPDLILLDMRMPVKDGYETIKGIRAIEKKKTPIIAVTASAFQEDMQKTQEAGADGYIRKPVKKHEVFECIESSLGVQYVYE
jgi:two-component system, sensor histidine kinase and response regulator